MQITLFTLALVTAGLWVAFAVELFFGNRSTKFLQDLPYPAQAKLPKVSVIIPACNEERNIEEALQSVLKQDYDDLEIIVLNDRSIDRTGAILERLSTAYPRLRVFHITQLPEDWLGKNHALQFGADKASGEILLFTDADIVMEPTAIRRAVHYLMKEKLDHLAVLMEARMPGMVLGMFALGFGIFFSVYSRFWRARNPRSRAHIGIGGFNMVRAAVYREIGGHAPIAMRPDDDMKLGQLIKQAGHSQELVFGKGLMYVEWYASVGEVIRGLEKNAFAGMRYSVFAVVGGTIAILLFITFPFPAVFLVPGAARWINLFTALFILAMSAYGARMQNLKSWYALGFPFITLLFLFIIWRSMIVTLANDGINWRGTHYSLAKLRANKV